MKHQKIIQAAIFISSFLIGSAGIAGEIGKIVAKAPIPLPGGSDGIGFDDLGFAPQSHRILAPGGPESLVIDSSRERAYTHLWSGSTLAIDLKKRKILETWPNKCGGSADNLKP